MKVRGRAVADTGLQGPVIGLDISLRAPGVCIAAGSPRSQVGRALTAHSAVIRSGEDYRGPERLSIVTEAIWDWINVRHEVRPGDLFVVEGYAFSRQHAHSLGELGGCLRRQIWEAGANLLVIPPSTLKRFLTGKGAGDKSAVIKHVFKRWGFDVDSDDQCDAFGCAVLGLVDRLGSDEWTAVEADILQKKVERFAGKGQSAGKREQIGKKRRR